MSAPVSAINKQIQCPYLTAHKCSKQRDCKECQIYIEIASNLCSTCGANIKFWREIFNEEHHCP